MKKYEYRTVRVHMHDTDELVGVLNGLGQLGWHVVEKIQPPPGQYPGATWILEREVES